jgi:hypothetical protein
MKNKRLDLITVRGSALYAITSATSDSQGVSAQNSTVFGTRLAAIADVYAYYRFVKIDFELKPNANQQVGVGYVPTAELTAATTVAQTQEADHRMLMQPGQSIPEHIRLSRNQLVGEGLNKWWKTQVDANVQSIDEFQGSLETVLSSSGSATIIVTYVCELCGLIAGALNPLKPKSQITNGVSPSAKTDEVKDAFEIIRKYIPSN